MFSLVLRGGTILESASAPLAPAPAAIAALFSVATDRPRMRDRSSEASARGIQLTQSRGTTTSTMAKRTDRAKKPVARRPGRFRVVVVIVFRVKRINQLNNTANVVHVAAAAAATAVFIY